jgi:hypothetical protein
VRKSQDTQARLSFQASSGSTRATVEYFGRYERIGALLDGHPEILRAVHGDLQGPLSTVAGRRRRAGKYTSETVLRILLVKVLESLSFRDTVVRVAKSARKRWTERLEGLSTVVMRASCTTQSRQNGPPEAFRDSPPIP